MAVPWPQDVSKRTTAAQILRHEWLVKEGVALDIALDSVVLKRLKNFAQMNKLKKACLMVIGQNLTPDEIAGAHACARPAGWLPAALHAGRQRPPSVNPRVIVCCRRARAC